MQRDSPISIGPPAVTVTDITEPTAVSAGIELIDQDAVQLQSLPLQARRVTVRLDTATVMLTSTNRRMRTHTRVREGLVGYFTFGPKASGKVNGLPVRPGFMIAAGPETEARSVVEPGWESVGFFLSPQDVRAHMAARQPEHDFHVPHGIEVLQVDPETARKLFAFGKRLTTTAARRPVVFNEGKKERGAAQVELLDILLPVLRLAAPLEPTPVERTRQAHSVLVKIAEDHTLTQAGEPFSVTDLCRATGASERALEYAFREVVGLSPVAYMIRLRLHRARQGLLAGTHGTTTVTAEAVKWGFWHFGEFSRAYKQCFGELPSDTLRRPRP